MTGFERLHHPLSRAIRRERLSEQMVLDLHAFRTEASYQDLPDTLAEAAVRGDEAHFLLRVTADMLSCFADDDASGALSVAQVILELPLALDPFDGRVYLLAACLAESVGDGEAQQRFAAHYGAYLEHFADARALLGLGEVLMDPYVSDVLAEALEDTSLTGTPAATVPIPTPLHSPAPIHGSGYAPFTSAGQETPARTYLVQVRKLTDPRIAQFAIFPSTLVDLTDGGDLGREDGRGRRYADLVLDFSSAQGLLRSLEPEDLALRFVFGSSVAFEPFSVADGTLFDVEVVLEEGRLYFKLVVPSAWVVAGLPLTAIWPNIESLVLLSYAKDH